MTYTEFVLDAIKNIKIGFPIYTAKISEKIEIVYKLSKEDASAATAVAVKRIMDRNILPNLRRYQKGIYYLTSVTPFGELGINKEQLIADKYLDFDAGYETGPAILNKMGLTTQIPRERTIATNAAKDCSRVDKSLGVTIRPPKIHITAENKDYLQTLDALELIEKTPVDAEHPYEIIGNYIYAKKLNYEILLALADKYYSRNTILQLAHTAKQEV